MNLETAAGTESAWPADLLTGYASWLEVKAPTVHRDFLDRMQADPEAARAEAAMFSCIRDNITLDVTPSGVPGKAGPDFLCKSEDGEFLLEVTHLSSNMVGEKSGYKKEVEDGVKSRSITIMTEFVYRVAQEKAGQVSGNAIPRVVAIVSEHEAADMLLGPIHASRHMVSGDVIQIAIKDPNAPGRLTMKHPNAPFFSVQPDGSVTPERRSISAILLVALAPYETRIVGLLHPDPIHAFPIRLLPQVPFVRIANWPCGEKKIVTEWTIHKPVAAVLGCAPASFQDDELQVP